MYMTAVMKLIPPARLFVDHKGQAVEVEIVETPRGHNTAMVRALTGNPFDMTHSVGEYIVRDRKRWYAQKWVNLDEIEER